MQYFTEQAASYREVEEKIRLKYGDQARIMTHRTVRLKGGFLGLFPKEGIEASGFVAQDGINSVKKKRMDIEEEKKKILAAVRNDSTIQKVLEEVQAIKEKIDTVGTQRKEEHPSIERIEELLVSNEFSADFVEETKERIKREFSLGDLENFQEVQSSVLEWIGEKIGIFEERRTEKPRIFILVGPTGVGKTTTIAKLAAVYGLSGVDGKGLKVRMLTIDNYRIAAKQQIETYGEIMGIPVTCVETKQDLQKALTLYQDVDLILVDTIGRSTKDYMKLAEMKELLDTCGSNAEVHLALSATTKTSDITEILKHFEPFGYSSVVLTKLDETAKIGNIISALASRQKPLSFITDGQRVPQDIERATVIRLLMNIEGFKINRQRLEKKFLSRQAALREWR